jgi:hypothetical protein
MTSSAGKCTATDEETGKKCECCEYREADHPDPDKPIKCLECFHGRSVHEKSANVTSILHSLLGPATAGRKGVSFEVAKKETNEGLKGSLASSLDGKGKKKVRLQQFSFNFTILYAHLQHEDKTVKAKVEKTFKVFAVVVSSGGITFDVSNLHLVSHS